MGYSLLLTGSPGLPEQAAGAEFDVAQPQDGSPDIVIIGAPKCHHTFLKIKDWQ
jgi:hypothetical protein